MRSIDVSTEVFAKIWASRIDGEEDENVILSRLLGVSPAVSVHEAGLAVRWRHDVRSALRSLGGSAPLKALYDEVRKIRLENGRSVPLNLNAIVRRELEFNSSDSNAYTGDHDWFRSVNGIGGGHWALREELLP